jgi:hypothetical protein
MKQNQKLYFFAAAVFFLVAVFGIITGRYQFASFIALAAVFYILGTSNDKSGK